MFDVTESLRFEHPRLESVLRNCEANSFLRAIEVDPWEQVLVMRDGAPHELLGEGRHVFWDHASTLQWSAVDLREQNLDVTGQEIMTGDKVTLRVNLLVVYQVHDAQRSILAVRDVENALYRAAQLAPDREGGHSR